MKKIKKIGRPKKILLSEEFEKKSNEYFTSCVPDFAFNRNGVPLINAFGMQKIQKRNAPTVEGLCHYLGISRATLFRYRHDPVLSHEVEMAIQHIMAYMINRLMDPDVQPSGIIFILKSMLKVKDG